MNTTETKTPRAPSAFAVAKTDFRHGVTTENRGAAVLASAVLAVETARKNRKGTAGTARAIAKVLESDSVPDFAPDAREILRNAVSDAEKGNAPGKAVSAILRKARETLRADGVSRDAAGFSRVETEAEAEAARKAAKAAAKSARAEARAELERLAAASGIPAEKIALALGKRKAA